MKTFITRYSYLWLVLFLMAGTLSCKKESGEGGSATITGTILIQNYNQVTHQTIGTPYPAGKVDVYIVYLESMTDDNLTYHDRVETAPDGTFAFRFLRRGAYRIYVYSDIVPKPATGNDEMALSTEVEITDKKGTVEMDDITINQY